MVSKFTKMDKRRTKQRYKDVQRLIQDPRKGGISFRDLN